MALLALLGGLSWGVRALYPANSFKVLVGIGIWAGAAAVCAILLKALSHAHDFLKALAAMWRPVILICVAGYLLFFNDQGRELGVSLLGERYVWPLVFLFLALMYWAANTWHTARLGLEGALANGVLGVAPLAKVGGQSGSARRRRRRTLALLAAAPARRVRPFLRRDQSFSGSVGAPPETAWDCPEGISRWLAWTAPLAIILAIAIVWTFDYLSLSKRSAEARTGACSRAGRSGVALAGETLLLGALVIIAFGFRRTIPHGFVVATIAISVSAIVFLVLDQLAARGDAESRSAPVQLLLIAQRGRSGAGAEGDCALHRRPLRPSPSSSPQRCG